jgi:hypothetical protein
MALRINYCAIEPVRFYRDQRRKSFIFGLRANGKSLILYQLNTLGSGTTLLKEC